MRIRFFLISLGFFTQLCFSQQVAIPFRDGLKWGVCNYSGNILIEPQYDKLEFMENQRAIITYKNNLSGLLLDGKILMEPQYNSIYSEDNLFVFKGKNSAGICNEHGEDVLKKPIVDLSFRGNMGPYSFYIAHHDDNTMSVFLMDRKKGEVALWLYEHYYSVQFAKGINSPNSSVFLVREKADSPLISEAWDLTKLPEKIPAKIQLLTITEYATLFARKAREKRKYNQTGESSYGTGTYRSDDTEVAIAVEEGGDEVVEERSIIIDPNTSDGSVTSPKEPIRKSLSFRQENGSVYVDSYISYQSNNKQTLEIKGLKSVAGLEIVPNYSSLKSNDTLIVQQNYIRYPQKGRTTMIFPYSSQKTIVFDSISKHIYTLNRSTENYESLFIVGNKNKEGIMKYGFFTPSTGVYLPIIHDEIALLKTLHTNSGGTFKTRIGKKFGLALATGEVLLPPEFNDFNPGYSANCINALKEGKYTVVYLTKENCLEVVPLPFEFQVSEVYSDFPKKGYSSYPFEGTIKSVIVFKLTDKEGNLMGYAAPNGKVFYKN